LDGLATIVKRSTGEISIKVNDKTALVLDFKRSTLLLNIIDPTILDIVEQESNELGLFEMLKGAKKVGTLLDNKGFLFSEEEKKLSVLVRKHLLKLAVY
jgi:hypothetical protein